MAVIVKELRGALIEAGASPLKAEAAAEAVLPASPAATKHEIKIAVADLKTHISEQLSGMTWRMATLLIAQGAAIMALVKLLP